MEKQTIKDVLKIIGVGSLVASSVVFPGLPTALIKTHKLFKNSNKRDLGVILKRLNNQKMISVSENGDRLVIEITEKGRHRLLEYDFEAIKLKQKRDGKWRLIIFDIPEHKKSNRDSFRRKLLQLGMIRVQDSVFASAFPCKNEVDFLTNFLEISDFVTLIKLDKFESGEELLSKTVVTNERYSD